MTAGSVGERVRRGLHVSDASRTAEPTDAESRERAMTLAGTTEAEITEPSLDSLELSIEAMACGACAVPVERALRHHDGVVDAGVNFATSRDPVVSVAGGTSPDGIVAAVTCL